MNKELEQINRVVNLLQGCESVFFITGAGISADSGLPTYRGIGGLYNDKVTEEGIPIEEALSGEMLQNSPEITWRYLLEIEKNCRKARFNLAHQVIAKMERHFKRVWVLTQNIDGFHYQAGSKNVIEIHGNMHRLICLQCRHKEQVADFSRIKNLPPICPECQGVIRPEVVFFGEMLPEDKCRILSDELFKGFDIYFSIGTTSVFSYIQQPILDARHSGRPTVEINPTASQISHIVDIRIPLGAAEALNKIWEGYKKQYSP